MLQGQDQLDPHHATHRRKQGVKNHLTLVDPNENQPGLMRQNTWSAPTLLKSLTLQKCRMLRKTQHPLGLSMIKS